MERISRDEMFIRIALVVAERGTCDRAKVGAVLVQGGKNIVAIGYNGAPAGRPHCGEVGHKLRNDHCTNAIHAEINCIDKLSHRDCRHDLTLYVTHYPCMDCVLAITCACKEYDDTEGERGLNIARLVYHAPYGPKPLLRTRLLCEAGVTIEQYPVGENPTT